MGKFRFVRARNQHLSLWQSVVAERARGQLRASSAQVSSNHVLAHPAVSATTEYVDAVMNNRHDATPDPDETDPKKINAHLVHLAFLRAQALADGDQDRAAALEAQLLLPRKYSDLDPGFLIQCAADYEYYGTKYHGVVAYNDWQKEGGGDINYGVIQYKLPKDARVGILGDWGTGLDDARELLRSMMTRDPRPDVLIHLGDIYYAGTPEECDANFARVITEVFDEVLGKGKRIPVFTIPGNHDYYSFAHGYFEMVTGLNAGTDAVQHASYFCLRTEDDGWQFLGMDSSYHDANPKNQVDAWYAGPWLEASEKAWHRDKLNNFEGATILLSHHQLFSAYSRINGRLSEQNAVPYKNTFLYETFKPYLPNKVAAWLWGHEHNLVLYQDGLFGLAKGRLVGCSAFEESTSEDPYKVNFPEVSYLDPDKYRLSHDDYYNHGYAIIDFGGRKQPSDPVQVSYYEFPSWGDKAPANPETRVVHTEEFARPTPVAQAVVNYGADVHLSSEEGLCVGPMKEWLFEYYPTLQDGKPVNLKIVGGSGAIKDGAKVVIETTEKSVGKYNRLGGSNIVTSLYYRKPGNIEQNWTVKKKDPRGGPEIRFGDEVYFVNASWTNQWLTAYFSEKWGGVYLTTKVKPSYYWSFVAP